MPDKLLSAYPEIARVVKKDNFYPDKGWVEKAIFRYISKIIEENSPSEIDLGEARLLKKTTLESLLKHIPSCVLAILSSDKFSPPPSIDTQEWVNWFIAEREKLKISRDQIISQCDGIDKSALSKFEGGKIDFAQKRRETLAKALFDCAHRPRRS